MSKIMDRLHTLYTTDDLRRLTFTEVNNHIIVHADVHGMTCRSAHQFINNIINLSDCSLKLVVIHGYHHGTAISKLVRSGMENKHINDISTTAANPGITYLDIA